MNMIDGITIKIDKSQKLLLVLLLLSIILTPLFLSISFLVQLDHQLFLQINSYYQSSPWDPILLIITHMGSLEFLFLLDITLFVIGKRKMGTYLLILLVSYSIIGYGLKFIIDRPRPYLEYAEISYLGSGFKASFPSGHSLGAAAFSTLLYVRNNPYLKFYLPLAFLVFFTRVFLGMHFPFDVLSGMWIGLIIGILVGNLNLENIHDCTSQWIRRMKST